VSLASDLLDQAEMLARREPKNPKQASLRRAVSAAYYALFHLLVEDAARLLTGMVGRADSASTARIARTFEHRGLKEVAQAFARSQLPIALRSDVEEYRTPADLKLVAEAFVSLQQVRHEADYNTGRPVSRADAQKLIQEARLAFEAWERMKGTDDARAYLACFSLWETWNKKR
jgi:uncharacterized protein (UPF0332 family)